MLTYDLKIEANGRTFKDKIRGCNRSGSEVKKKDNIHRDQDPIPNTHIVSHIIHNSSAGDQVIIYKLCGYQTGM